MREYFVNPGLESVLESFDGEKEIGNTGTLKKILLKSLFFIFIYVASSFVFWEILKRNIIDNEIQNGHRGFYLCLFLSAFKVI